MIQSFSLLFSVTDEEVKNEIPVGKCTRERS